MIGDNGSHCHGIFMGQWDDHWEKKTSGAIASESENHRTWKILQRCLTPDTSTKLTTFLEEIVYNILCIWVLNNNI